MNCFPHGSIPAPSRECIHPSAALLCYWSWKAGKLRSFKILTRAPKMPLCMVQRGDCLGTLCSTHMPNLYWIKTHFFPSGVLVAHMALTLGESNLCGWNMATTFCLTLPLPLHSVLTVNKPCLFRFWFLPPSLVQRPHLKKSLERLCCHGPPGGILTS